MIEFIQLISNKVRHTFMQNQKPPFDNLHNLLPTKESRIELSEATNIPLTTINNWLDLNSGVVPKADALILMAKYFNCSVDYLLDLADVRYKG